MKIDVSFGVFVSLNDLKILNDVYDISCLKKSLGESQLPLVARFGSCILLCSSVCADMSVSVPPGKLFTFFFFQPPHNRMINL